ncbi:YtxH domain-containing protein [Geminocystis sp.]|uniref:YtxH domain-containing protein n=1 Tax=Geminocystis sp. TaxID=2664100 RepID=UPI0035936844
MSENQKNSNFIVGFIVGGVVATVTTILLTPSSGKENRKVLRKTAQALPEMAEDFSSSVQINSNRISESARQKWDNTLNRLKVAISAGIEASQNDLNQG